MNTLNIKIIAFTYLDDELQVLLTTENSLPTFEYNNQDPIADTVIKYITNETAIHLKKDDIDEQSLYNSSGQLYIPILTQLRSEYSRALLDDPTIRDYKFQKIKYKNRELSDLDEKLIDQSFKALKNRYKLESLPGIKNLLPYYFTTKTISSLLNNCFSLQIKRNNIGYNFRNYIKYVKKDRSKQGRPTKIYKLKETKK